MRRTTAFAICKSLDDRKEKDKGCTVPWEAEYAPLCSAYQDILKAMKGPLEGHERKRLMCGVPYFKERKVEPPVYNHRGDKNHKSEKGHRAWESSFLGILRVQAALEGALCRKDEGDEDEFSPNALLGRLFSLTLDLTHRIRYWKSKSIPDAISTPNPLFSKAHLQMSKFAGDITRQPSNTGRQYGRNFRRQRDSQPNSSSNPSSSSTGDSHAGFPGRGRRGGGGKGRGKGSKSTPS